MGNVARGYFFQDKLLVRKWVPCEGDFVGELVFQVVVPEKFCDTVLKTAHDESGHFGCEENSWVLRYFFYQLRGKPSQSVKPAPLRPIQAISQPFEHLIIDCVGPLPTSKCGCPCLLTVMCQILVNVVIPRSCAVKHYV